MEQMMEWSGRSLPLYTARALVIGSGCAGLNAADRLRRMGVPDVMLMTERMESGTSRNAGSDKQTYYKLSLSGEDADSVRDMAQTLYAPGVDGDIALAEAAGSVRAFLNLAEAGVPFPTNEYGEYVGYRTDHDPRCRATSAGPLTSRMMTECLEARVRSDGIRILDHALAFRVLARDGRCAGVLGLDLRTNDYFAVAAGSVIIATGGPAAIYRESVYPESQHGSLGMALEAGAMGSNLHLWQYGLASTRFRWNVSGSYQQALPSYLADGEEFLPAGFGDAGAALAAQFRKGYEWPFDVRKAEASSRVDLMVHDAIHRGGKRVWMDYTREPQALSGGFSALEADAEAYLKNCGALIPSPIARLEAINRPAIDLYLAHGIDIRKEPLEIAVCAQHHNGGVCVNADWETALPGLYAAGEAAGTFGAYRPGGAALNSTQVGSFRAADHIARTGRDPQPDAGWFAARLGDALPGFDPGAGAADAEALSGEMSRCAAHVRVPAEMRRILSSIHMQPRALPAVPGETLATALRYRDQVLATGCVLSAMLTAAEEMGSVGSGLIRDAAAPRCPDSTDVVETSLRDAPASRLRPRRPMPLGDQWFERVWKSFREVRGL